MDVKLLCPLLATLAGRLSSNHNKMIRSLVLYTEKIGFVAYLNFSNRPNDIHVCVSAVCTMHCIGFFLFISKILFIALIHVLALFGFH